MLKLKTIGAPYKQFSLTTGAYRIGSAPDSEFCIEDPSISPYHCEVVVTSNISVRDISSSHETYIDEQQITSASLQAGQTLRLGTVKLILEAAEAKSAVVPESSGGQFWGSTAEAQQRRARILEVGGPWLLLLALTGLVVGLIINARRNRQQAPDPKAAAAAKAAAKAAPPTPPPAPAPAPTPTPAKAAEQQSGGRPRSEPATNRQAQLTNVAVRLAKLAAFPADARIGPLLEESLETQQRILGPTHREVTKTLGNLGQFYSGAGQFQKAEPYLKKAANNTLGPKAADTPEAAAALSNLGEMYAASGQAAKAEPVLAKALAIREKTLSPTNAQTGASLHNLAAVKAALGNLPEAIPLMERALKNFSESLELDDPAIRSTLGDLAKMNDAAGRPAQAERFARAAVQAAEAAVGESHPATAKALDDLASHLARQGDRAQAAPLLARAASIAKQTLGPGHPETEKYLEQLARLNVCESNSTNGSNPIAEALAAKIELLETLLACASERDLLTMGEAANPYSLAVAAGSVPNLARDVLRYKGVILDALLEQRSLSRIVPAAQADVDQLRDTRNKLAEILLDVQENWSAPAVEAREARKAELLQELHQLEKIVAAQVPAFGRAQRAMEVTLERVEKVLPKNAALLEFIRYSRCTGTNEWEPCYGVVIISPSAAPVWISYGLAEPIEQAIDRYHTAATEAELRPAIQELHKSLWAPLKSALPASAQTLFLSPDEALNLVPFAALLTPEDEFLGQKFSIRYVSTGRDLMESPKPDSTAASIILSNPDFATANAAMSANAEPVLLRDANRRQLRAMPLPRLSSMVEEGARVELLFRNQKQQMLALSGAQASEAVLAQAESPRIIHLATSGFFLPEEADIAKQKERAGGRDTIQPPDFLRVSADGHLAPARVALGASAALSNPLQRSGIALAGAQATFDLWGKEETPPPGNDGIATCDEIGTLQLTGTELVALSASDFRTGMARSGQAILALRRAMAQAGAENLLIVLGTGTDDESDQILSDFYNGLLEKGNAARMMAEVQRDWLVRLRKEHGLMAAARAAGPFIVSSTVLAE